MVTPRHRTLCTVENSSFPRYRVLVLYLQLVKSGFKIDIDGNTETSYIVHSGKQLVHTVWSSCIVSSIGKIRFQNRQSHIHHMISKIIETIVKRRLIGFIKCNRILAITQHSFHQCPGTQVFRTPRRRCWCVVISRKSSMICRWIYVGQAFEEV